MKELDKQLKFIREFTNGKIENALIEAPPGTGKTYTAVLSAIKFLNNKLGDNSEFKSKVLILTFSKNARAQVEKQLDIFDQPNEIKKHIEITNFHSFFQKYIWAYKSRIGLHSEELLIASSIQRKKFLKKYLKDNIEIDYDCNIQMEWADNLLEVDIYPNLSKRNKKKISPLIDKKEDIIDAIKKMNNDGIIGFSDMSYYILKLFKNSTELVRLIINKYPLIIVDEYQDVSDKQNEFIDLLSGADTKNIFLADSMQQIYEWRGAKRDRLNNLLIKYKEEVNYIKFEKNYRYGDKKDIENLLTHIRAEGKMFSSPSENIEEIKVKVNVDELNLYNPMVKNKMLSKMSYKIGSILKKHKPNSEKSIGILCYSNEQVEYYKKKLNEIFKIRTRNINNNSLEHNIIGEMISFIRENELPVEKIDLIREAVRFLFDICDEKKLGGLKEKNVLLTSEKKFRGMIKKDIKKIIKIVDDGKRLNSIWKFYKNIFQIINESGELTITHDIKFLLKKIFRKKVNIEEIQNIYLRYQYLKAHKELSGVYILNFHQSKGREFDYVYIIDEKNLQNNLNLYYVALSRVREKLFLFNWIK